MEFFCYIFVVSGLSLLFKHENSSLENRSAVSKQMSELIISACVLGSSEAAPVAEWTHIGRVVEKAFGFVLLAFPDMQFM